LVDQLAAAVVNGPTLATDEHRLYQEIVGSLMYLSVWTRPDISFTVSTLARGMALGKATAVHMTAAKRALRYLKSNPFWLTYSALAPSPLVMTGLCDANWGGVNEPKSTSGWCFLLAGAAVSHSSKLQKCTALSSMESEYITASDASRECVYMRRLLSDIGIPQQAPTILYCDNQSAIASANNGEGHHARTKHINVRYHYIREQIADGQLAMQYISTDKQVADILTKSLPADKHRVFASGLGLARK
jgi:hypothetical protein